MVSYVTVLVPYFFFLLEATSWISADGTFELKFCWAQTGDNAAEECFQSQLRKLNPNTPSSNLTANYNVLVYTVASNATDGYLRYIRSANVYNIPVETLGMNEPWNGGSMKATGGGQKINLLRKALEEHKNDPAKVVLFSDSYDVIFQTELSEIIEKFMQTEARILFSAELFCWPDKSLASQYPATSRGKQYLNSGAFIGFTPDVYSVLSSKEIADDEDDQLFYTHVYLNQELREKHKIQLDHNSDIFLNLYGAMDDLEMKWLNQEAHLENVVAGTKPALIHGNGPSKIDLLGLGNYLARAWLSGDGCQACKEGTVSLAELKESEYPRVLMAVFLPHPTPFLEEFFLTLKRLQYPRDRIDLFVYSAAEGQEKMIDSFLEKSKFRSVKRILPNDAINEQLARSLAVEQFLSKKSDFFFALDGDARLDNPHALKLLIEQNRGVVAPLLVRPYKAWSNFWGAITEDGFYARSSDYMDIVNNNKRGLWNVPYITSCYLINAAIIKNPRTRPVFTHGALDHDMAFALNMRSNGVFMYVSNRVDFGHLIDSSDFNLTPIHPELHNIFQNQWDWEKRYIHENYTKNFDLEVSPLQPCTDVFWFPVVSDRFCDELVATMENFGKWSDGSNKDERLGGGYEAVPTRDIHMNQVGLEKEWLHFLKLYVLPLNQRVFAGYQDGAPRSIMNFVVRYRPDEQPSLRPHHDTSTYTINVALNTPIQDYEGGGCRFIRYNCSVTNTRKGWLLMHPGRLTHYHEGLLVTRGTRYIMVSFIDP